MIHACRICGDPNIEALLPLGRQPVSSHFLTSPAAPETRIMLDLALCRHCGLPQLAHDIPVESIVAPFDWITYNEPEDHLDGLIDKIIAATNLPQNAGILGISYKDDSTLERLRRLGWRNTSRVQPSQLGIGDPHAGIETLQHCLSAGTAGALLRTMPPADMIIARHILEHAFNPRAFIQNIAALLKPGGLLVVEAPDFSTALRAGEYPVIWEEHPLYFTPAVLRRNMAALGFDILLEDIAPYPMENSLTMILRQSGTPTGMACAPASELAAARGFAAGFTPLRDRIRARLAADTAHRPRAVLGAGHLACKFINFFGLGDYMDLVIDDHPRKRGLFMPGSHLPIAASDALAGGAVKQCLLAVNPLAEEKVINRHAGFAAGGGTFASIFAVSPRFLLT